MSWARASASVKSSFNPSADATVRAICETSIVCVSRFRKWSDKPAGKTCVLFSSLRNARA